MLSTKATSEYRLPVLSGGLNLRDMEHKINDNQSPAMLNMWYRDRVLNKRWGQEYITLTNGATVVNFTAIHAISPLYNDYVCIHADDKLYKWNLATNVVTAIATVANADGCFIAFNGKLYHIDGSDIREISASYAVTVIDTAEAYAPLLYYNCTPTLTASEANEPANLLTPKFRMQYNGDGTATYKLPFDSVDTTTIIVKVGGTTKTAGTHYNWTAGSNTVTFTSGNYPATGTNNVEITAYKTVAGNKARITGCKFGIPFGGESADVYGGSRVFLMKNAAYPQTYWYSDLGAGQSYGMRYFPDTQYETLTQDADAITTAAKQAGQLIIFKERSLFSVGYEFDGTNVYYPVKEFNSVIGCDMPDSVQLIENSLVFANTYGGVYIIINTAGSAEENVKPISGNINGTEKRPGLLQETNLKAASSIDYERKYWLCVNDKVYLWDYDLAFYSQRYAEPDKRLSWFKFDNIRARIWHGGEALYYSDGAKLVKFIDTCTDFGAAVCAEFKTRAFDFGYPNYLKTITKIYPSLRIEKNSGATIVVSSEKTDNYFSVSLTAETFAWDSFDWSMFTWGAYKYSHCKPFKVKMKKVIYAQIWFYDRTAYRDMAATDLIIEFFINGKVRK